MTRMKITRIFFIYILLVTFTLDKNAGSYRAEYIRNLGVSGPAYIMGLKCSSKYFVAAFLLLFESVCIALFRYCFISSGVWNHSISTVIFAFGI